MKNKSVPQIVPQVLLFPIGEQSRCRFELGLAVVMRSSADYWFDKKGERRKSRRPASTRGLNQNYNRRLKKIFKGAALIGISREPFKPSYEQLIAKGLRPELARLTLARKIAAITLAVWKKGERFDPEKLTKLTT
jgi:hypothetical protein